MVEIFGQKLKKVAVDIQLPGRTVGPFPNDLLGQVDILAFHRVAEVGW